MGFAMIGLILFNILVNVLLFIYTNLKLINSKLIKPLIQRCSKCREQRKLNQDSAKKYDLKMAKSNEEY